MSYILVFVGVQPSKKWDLMGFCKLLGAGGLCVLLSACAAQTSYGLFEDARAKVAAAKKANPKDPQLVRAEVMLETGQEQLREAKYGKAEQNFLTAIQISDRILKSGQAADLASSPEPLPELTPEQIAAANAPTKEETREKLDRTSLPREALAKYLAEKRKPAATMKEQKALPAPKPAPVASLPKPEQTPIAPLPVEEAKIPPLPKRDEMRVEMGGSEPIELEPLKRVARGRLSFEQNESKLTDSSLSQLDGMAQFLIENPSNTLLLSPTVAPNEGDALSLERFQQVADYLKARGVPDDQIRLDNVKKSGNVAALELFLIDH